MATELVLIDGANVTTLRELLRPGLRAVILGFNPAPGSVALGHFWQSSHGRSMFRLLQEHRRLAGLRRGQEDDDAFDQGIGFADLLRRPTRSMRELRFADLANAIPGLIVRLNEQLSPDEAFAAGRLLSDWPPGAEALPVLGDAAGRMVHVSEVPRGASCGCLCPACCAPLIARHGEVRVWHFAHQSRARCDPAGAITAAMRGFAQQVLQAGHGLRLPDLSVSVGTEKKPVVRDRVLQPDSVRIEKRDGVTELILTQGGRELLVELATRRSLSRKRQAAICDAERAAIEIDLTAVVQERDAAVIGYTDTSQYPTAAMLRLARIPPSATLS